MSTSGVPDRDPVDAIIEFLDPYVAPIIERINVDEFTTPEFVMAMQMDPLTKQAYERALAMWHENNPRMARMVIHGQVIPQLLRRSGLVE